MPLRLPPHLLTRRCLVYGTRRGRLVTLHAPAHVPTTLRGLHVVSLQPGERCWSALVLAR